MNSATATAVGIAIVGVLGTLLAPIVSQRLATRARREEFDQQRIVQMEEYTRQQSEQVVATKRRCYLALFIACRHYRVELMNYLYAVKRKEVNEPTLSRLEEARLAFMASISETQLIASLTVMATIDPIRHANSRTFGAIKNLEEGHPEPDGSFEEIRAFIYTIWDTEWPRVVKAVRADLGVAD
jgi:hypothetical protein